MLCLIIAQIKLIIRIKNHHRFYVTTCPKISLNHERFRTQESCELNVCFRLFQSRLNIDFSNFTLRIWNDFIIFCSAALSEKFSFKFKASMTARVAFCQSVIRLFGKIYSQTIDILYLRGTSAIVSLKKASMPSV